MTDLNHRTSSLNPPQPHHVYAQGFTSFSASIKSLTPPATTQEGILSQRGAENLEESEDE